MSLDLNGNGPKNIKGTGDGTPGLELVQQIQDLLVEAGIGGIADAAWSGSGNATVIAALKRIALNLGVTTVLDGSGTVTAGGSPQTLFSGATPGRGYFVCNTDDTDLWVSDVGTASAGGTSILIAPGQMFSTPPSYIPPGPVSVFGASTGKIFAARRW